MLVNKTEKLFVRVNHKFNAGKIPDRCFPNQYNKTEIALQRQKQKAIVFYV